MQCVVFDMDGVLFDSEALVLQCWEQTAKLHGIPEIQEICHRCLGSNADMARQMFLEKVFLLISLILFVLLLNEIFQYNDEILIF